MPQARVTLRGVVELVSMDELDPRMLERVKRSFLERTDDAHLGDADELQEGGEQLEGAQGETAPPDEAAQERADAALEQLRQDLQNPETRKRRGSYVEKDLGNDYLVDNGHASRAECFPSSLGAYLPFG